MRYGIGNFGVEGTVADTACRNRKAIAEYRKNRLAEEEQYEQWTTKERIDPFTGEQAERDSPFRGGPVTVRRLSDFQNAPAPPAAGPHRA